MTGIEELRDVCRALKGSPWCGTDVATIGGEPAYEKLRKIADQIEHEMLPRTRFEDGKIARIGEVARYLGKNRTIANIYVTTSGYHRVLFNDNVNLTLRPSEMLLRPVVKVLDADGVEIKVGDEVWCSCSGCGPYKVSSVLESEMVTVESEHVSFTDLGIEFTHRRPEPPDSWERVEEDAAKSVCGYFGKEGESCTTETECPARNSDSCNKFKAKDIVRRCKKLAGVE